MTEASDQKNMNNNIIIANWKMRLNHQESLDLINQFLKQYNPKEQAKTEVVICPSFTELDSIAKKISKTNLKLGAQDCFWENTGAFTGEISASQLKELGCEFVIIGHSERRNYLLENDEMINRKIKVALANQLIPIICVGEQFDERQNGDKELVLMRQLEKALTGVELKKDQKLVVAYEPVWVVGSGQAVEPAEAEHANQVLRQVILDHFGSEKVYQQVYLIYGGSVDLKNIKNFLNQPAIDGFLVGGASLKPLEFWQMIKVIAE